MNKFFKDILLVKGKYSIKRLMILLFALLIVTSWAAHLFFGVNVPEYMFNLLGEILKSLSSESYEPFSTLQNQ